MYIITFSGHSHRDHHGETTYVVQNSKSVDIIPKPLSEKSRCCEMNVIPYEFHYRLEKHLSLAIIKLYVLYND